MERKFECWHCHKTFVNDDRQWVECPYCHSDNVEYASWHLPKKSIYIIAAFIVVTSLVLIIVPFIGTSDSQKDQIITLASNDSAKIQQVVIDTTFINETGLSIPPSIKWGDIVPNDEGLYSFQALVEYAPSIPYVYTITDIVTNKEVARSADGAFENVPYSNDSEWRYNIQIVDANVDTLLCTPQVISGFVKIEKVSRKMTPDELQALINKRDESLIGVGENKYLSPVCKLHFKGLPSSVQSVPENIADVLEKLDMEVWEKVQVVDLEYDDTQHINSITFKVKVNDFSF